MTLLFVVSPYAITHQVVPLMKEKKFKESGTDRIVEYILFWAKKVFAPFIAFPLVPHQTFSISDSSP